MKTISLLTIPTVNYNDKYNVLRIQHDSTFIQGRQKQFKSGEAISTNLE